VKLQVDHTDWAVITPSYRGDFERCQLLCESMDAFVTGPWHHYIIVDRIDFELFKPMQGARRTVLVVEDILPPWLQQIKFLRFFIKRSVYFNAPFGFNGGWQIQQLVKLAMAFHLREIGLLYCDSDVFFLKPFDVSTLVTQGKFRFFRSDEIIEKRVRDYSTFLVASSKQLGLGKNPFPGRVYVENLVPWHAQTARNMCTYIAKISGRDWRKEIGSRWVLSEYTLYGLFVERIMKDKSIFFETGQKLCRTAWTKDNLVEVNLDQICDGLSESEVAVGFQSFLGVNVSDLRVQLNRAHKKYF
jgi:Family of unknown function (DUF6492)